MHPEAISPEQRAALQALSAAASEGFYLAEGTGLCLRLAHRRSFDIDLFREAAFDPEALARRLTHAGLVLSNVRTEPSTLWADIGGVPTSLMAFPYPIIAPAEATLGVPVASLSDIAAMKLEAIASRGARKDFVDLYFICQEGLALRDAVAAFKHRFASAHPDVAHRVMSLTYFDDAEREPELLLLRRVEWRTIRRFFEQEARSLWTDGL
jgi:hypothetical protein